MPRTAIRRRRGPATEDSDAPARGASFAPPAQRAIVDLVQHGPRLSGQRAVLQGLFGDVLQKTEGRYISGRYVSGAEQDKDVLTSTYYATWAYMDDLYVDHRYFGYRSQVPTLAWKTAWDKYQTAMESAIKTWIQGGRQDFAPFARGGTVFKLHDAVLSVGGMIHHGQQRPGSIPMRDDPDEVVVDTAVSDAKLAYSNWDLSLANRGPFHPVSFTKRQLQALKGRPISYLGGNGWKVHPSLTTKYAFHRPGPQNAEPDPKTDAPATFIYHIREA